jgi:hypothetical protein
MFPKFFRALTLERHARNAPPWRLGLLAAKMIGLRFAPRCHSSPGKKAWSHLAHLIKLRPRTNLPIALIVGKQIKRELAVEAPRFEKEKEAGLRRILSSQHHNSDYNLKKF